MPPMTPLMIVLMVVFMAVFMVAIHFMRSHHHQHGSSVHGIQGAFPLINWSIKILLHLGIPVTILGPMKLLTVRGRKTGKPRTIPVDLHERDGQRFLIATHGKGNWVYNLRASGEGTLSLGWSRQRFTAQELVPEAAGPVLKDILGPLLASQGIRGSALRQHLGITSDASISEFIDVARDHPVFKLDPPANRAV